MTPRELIASLIGALILFLIPLAYFYIVYGLGH